MPDTLPNSVTDVVELTRELVRCESVTPREGGALVLLERTLGSLGFRCERMDFTQSGTDDVANLYARVVQQGRHATVPIAAIFRGQVDNVPGQCIFIRLQSRNISLCSSRLPEKDPI